MGRYEKIKTSPSIRRSPCQKLFAEYGRLFFLQKLVRRYDKHRRQYSETIPRPFYPADGSVVLVVRPGVPVHVE